MARKIEMTAEQARLYTELKKLSKRANQRIVRLEREFGTENLAIRNLRDKLAIEPLQAWTVSGRVKVNKSMSEIQMKATIKATNQFLNSKLSTRTGIKKAKKKAIETLRVRFSTDVKELTTQEAEVLYNIFTDKDVNQITNFVQGSDAQAVTDNAREENQSFNDFVAVMNSVKKYNGHRGNYDDILRKLYMKYVYKGNGNEIEVLYSNVFELINNAESISDLEEVESIISDLKADNKISDSEFNYIVGAIDTKRREIEL